MKVLFINIAYPKNIFRQLLKDSRGILQIPCNVFQWAVINGLEQCGADYTLAGIPALPAWPRYSHLYAPEGVFYVDGKERGLYLRYCNAPAIKQLSQKLALQKYIWKWCDRNRNEDRLAVLIYTPQAGLLSAAISLKKEFPNLLVATIITDLIENAFDYKSNRTLFKRFQVQLEARGEHALFPLVDKFILLTRQMTDYIPEAINKFIVIEGISLNEDNSIEVANDGTHKTLLYTGVLEEFAGVRLLVDAFMKTNNNDFRLVICGNGSDADYVKKASIRDFRIDFRGNVDRDEAIRLQKKSTLLINPRQPNGSITKYSFPSKTMEYMSSGTPMIGYHLEGIPEEYYEYMYTPDNLTVEGLSLKINELLQLPHFLLKEKAKMAKNFIVNNKSSKCQVQKILDFIDS